ncbi:hypothetical protein KKI93_16010, partial [Xenorhabdus bovienii]
DRSSAPCREAAYLTLSSPSVKPLFPGFSLAVLGGVSSLSVGQWWRIIGTFPRLTIVFLNFISVRVFFQQNWHLRSLFDQKLVLSTTMIKSIQ